MEQRRFGGVLMLMSESGRYRTEDPKVTTVIVSLTY